MNLIEDINTEFKEQYSDEIKKTAVAFANESGGKIYVGVSNDGTVVGVDNPDAVGLQIGDSIRNSIKPDITRFFHVSTEQHDGKSVVVVTVERGVSLPYYLGERGLKPSGVYVRVGGASVPASEEHIRQMIKQADGDKYITGRSLLQDLTFERAKKEFDEKELKFGEAQKKSLGILNANLQYTNLGLLLSDQCKHTIKVAVFEGKNKSVFKSRKEFDGSLFQQLSDTLDYLDYFNLIHAEIGRAKRTETRDYPVDAIREALLNAIIHREYALSASTFVNVYDDRMEFLSVGGLVSGTTLEAAKSGVSHTRNEQLANVFYRLEFVEAYGTGLIRIMGDYAGSKTKPTFDVTDSSFMLTLPNMRLDNADGDDQENAVIKLIERDGFVTVESLSDALNLGTTRCYNILKKMHDGGRVVAIKNGRRLEYKLPN